MKLYIPSRIARALGERFFFKPNRDNSPKSAQIRRPYPPGMHGKRSRRGGSEYGVSLAEKQKVRYLYGVSDSAMKRYVREAGRDRKKIKTEALMQLLERRLDNVAFRLGLAPSRRIARQLVSHGHITVNGKRVRTASFAVRPGEIVAIHESVKSGSQFAATALSLKKYDPPAWLAVDPELAQGSMKRLPATEDNTMFYNLDKIIEFYSR
jgi:small subunit ribosomal protein S4